MRKWKIGLWIAVWMMLIFIFAGCQNVTKDREESSSNEKSNVKMTEQYIPAEKENSQTEVPMEETEENIFYETDASGNTLQTRFPTPEGYERIACEESSFGSFLRTYLLLPEGEPVHLYDGSLKGRQEDHAAVFDMELVEGDLQQCADSVLRLYAEYFYESGQYDRMNFELTNGFVLSFDKWRAGMRVSVDGNDTSWVSTAQPSDSQESFESYLRFLFNYAGTLSMGNECLPMEIDDIQPGDIFLYSGSPGHVVMVLDVCEKKGGERAFLLGQGYMPAQQFHVLKNPLYEDDPWYYTGQIQYPFQTPEYTFEEGSLMRPTYL